MSYSADQYVLPLPLAATADPRPDAKLAGLYQVSLRIFDDGHACTQLQWLDMGSRRLISEQLGCYQAVTVGRTQVLALLSHAALTAYGDTAAGVE